MVVCNGLEVFFKKNRYQVELYKVSVEKNDTLSPVRIHCQQDFRGSGSRSLNTCIFYTDLSL